MKRTGIKSLLCALLFVLTLVPQLAYAAPFCAVFSYGTQCWYYSWEACRQAAGSSGACIINQEEVRPPSRGAPFCVVTSYGTQCWYYDADSCRRAAATSGGVCAVNPNR